MLGKWQGISARVCPVSNHEEVAGTSAANCPTATRCRCACGGGIEVVHIVIPLRPGTSEFIAQAQVQSQLVRDFPGIAEVQGAVGLFSGGRLGNGQLS